ncbi:phage tail tube protein [Pseudogulbenkiania ferrooxidans]|uniref:Phage tail tube protein, putative n=1 Tax=Pseudogulbenkiania ferrooxidans 2002 TaxID=279714 RepID=B9YYV0_9NEIS|nr:phage tail tube protein [Pseudogulbenkiania ferrooxidans]EEG10303.1 phage tail tube protein, putative [Pseudogulbenkiania ferrooxidans 2002]
MSSKKVAGTCYIKVDGDQLAVTGGVEVPLTDVEREAFKTSAGVHFSETDVIPYVKVECVVPKDFPREKITQSTDMTITAELANGSVYVLSDGFLVNPAAFKGDDGKVELEFNGDKGIWQ